MSNYRKDAAANRDALFGPSQGGGGASSGGPNYKRNAAANRDALFGSSSSRGNSRKPAATAAATSSRTSASSLSYSSSSASTAAAGAKPTTTTSSSAGYSYSSTSSSKLKSSTTSPTSSSITSTLTGTAKVERMKEAEEFRVKAKKAMSRGVFSKPDPIAGGMFYKRAADAYQQCGENRLERLHRIASGDCQMGQGAYATAAAEYTRAADLVQISEEETSERKRKEGWKLHSDAANAYRQMGEFGRAGKSAIMAAMALTWEEDDDSDVLDKQALTALEEAVEAHVPDVLNRYARYRQTGTSAFVDPNSAPGETPSKETMDLAKHHMVTTSYAHEPMLETVNVLVPYREFASALYAAGAGSAILEADGIATLSLSRVYVMETILMLAMGDPVAAEKYFLQVHVQNNTYLTSRECKLAEDLTRAISQRDSEALEEARSPSGSNRAALANLPSGIRELVMQLRISGIARKHVPTSSTKATSEPVAPPSAAVAAAVAPRPPVVEPPSKNPETEAPPPPVEASLDDLIIEEPVEKAEEKGAPMDANALLSEMDDLMNDMGLGDSEEEEIDDDEIDLR